GRDPTPVALSNVQQNSWLGYYILGTDTVDTLELRVSRTLVEGLHEDLDLTNYSPRPVKLRLALHLREAFADQARHDGAMPGPEEATVRTSWGGTELRFEDDARRREARLRQGLAIRIRAGSEPSWQPGRLEFAVESGPRETWHAC